MEGKTRIHLEQIFNKWGTAAQATAVSSQEDGTMHSEVSLAGSDEPVSSSAAYEQATVIRQTKKSWEGFSLWRWLFHGLKEDKIGAVVTFSLLLWAAFMACGILAYMKFMAE